MNVLDYQNKEEVMGGYDLKILHDGSKIEQARFTPRHQKERNVTQHLNGRYLHNTYGADSVSQRIQICEKNMIR
jgi:hypothetical protein